MVTLEYLFLPARIARLEEELAVPLADLMAQAERVAIAEMYPLAGNPLEAQVVRLQDIPLADIAADAERRALHALHTAEAAVISYRDFLIADAT